MDFQAIINLIRRWTIDSFFPALDKHAKDSSQPVVDCLYDIDEEKKKRHQEATSETVKAIESLEKTVKGQQNEIINPESIANPIVEAQNATTEAIKSIPEVKIPEIDFSSLESKMEEFLEVLKGKEMVVNQGDVVVDTKEIVKAIETLQKNLPKLEKQEIIDYTLMLDEQMGILEQIRDKKGQNYTEELGAILEWLKVISEKQYPKFPDFSFSDTGRLKVEIDRTASGGNVSNINNASGTIINPATADNQTNGSQKTKITDTLGTPVNPAAEETLQASLSQYHDANIDVSSMPMYFGNLDKDGNWYILQLDLDVGTELYIRGSTDYDTNWTNRTTLTYQSFNLVF